jgi:linoleoyl-CoA desaturase
VHALSMLNREFVARGWNKRATGRILLDLLANLVLSLGGIAVFVISDNLLVKAAGMLVSTAGSLGVSTNTHTSSHYATSDKRWLNRALTFFGYPFFFGASATYWWNKHVAVHHPTPNVIGLDDDADLLPFFTIDQKHLEQATGFQRWWFRVQGLFVPFAIALNCFNVLFTSWRFLARALRDPSRRTMTHIWDLATLGLHVVVWLVIPAFIFGWGAALGFNLMRIALMGYALFIGFAPAHFPLEAKFVDSEGLSRKDYFKQADFILLQTATAVNFRTGPLGRLLCSGVEFQIEHHLFPGVSHVYYPQMSKLVQKFCEEHGYPYRTLGWWEGTWKSLLVFWKPKPIVPRLASLRQTEAPKGQVTIESEAEFPSQQLVA